MYISAKMHGRHYHPLLFEFACDNDTPTPRMKFYYHFMLDNEMALCLYYANVFGEGFFDG